MKIAINVCYGGFSVSDAFATAWNEMTGEHRRRYSFDGPMRTNPDFIKMVEEWGDKANGSSSKLQVVEIPDCATDWVIDDYDGAERVIYVDEGKLRYA